MVKRVIATIFGPVLVCGMAWLGGYDFSGRGITTAMVFLFVVLVTLWQWFAPWWDD